MIQIIKNKRYDTDTATKIADWGNGLGSNDFGNCREARGGAASRYREQSGNMWCSGSAIKPLTNEQAYQWCEEHGLTEVIENLFADRIQDA